MNMENARREFAGLDDEWAYFDNAGGSFTLNRVIDRVAEYMRSTPVQLGGGYPLSQQAAQRQADAVRRLAGFINAAEPREIVLGSSSTALTWQIARALRPTLRAGDEIIITEIDHEANRSPWLSLADAGVTIRTWEVDKENFALSLEQLQRLLNERTRLVAFAQVSNVLGRIEPATEIVRLAHAAGARVFIDGVAHAPHRQVDVQALGADFYVMSLYKIFGPHLGMLHGRLDALLELGNINHAFLPADALPYKLQPGGASYELAWGAAGIVDYFDAWPNAFTDIAAFEAMLSRPLLDFLSTHPRVELIGPADSDPAVRVPIISFRAKHKSSREVVQALEARKLAARHGNFNAHALLHACGIDIDDGVVRVSFAHYNTMEEVQRLIAALDEVL